MITEEELHMLREIEECQGAVEDDQYTPEERARLQALRKAGLAMLVWTVTPQGKKRMDQ